MFPVNPIPEPDQKSSICNHILRALADRFGVEPSIVDYVHKVKSMPFWAAFDGEAPIGFVALKIRHTRRRSA